MGIKVHNKKFEPATVIINENWWDSDEYAPDWAIESVTPLELDETAPGIDLYTEDQVLEMLDLASVNTAAQAIADTIKRIGNKC